MVIKLYLDDDVALYQQLKQQILYELAAGNIKEGERLPSVRRLAESLSINMHTVNKAYNQLAVKGFLSVEKGRGAIVNGKDKYFANEQDLINIKQQIQINCAEAKCRSISCTQYLQMCKMAYESFEGDSND